MKFIRGFRILLTKTWYNFSFILSLAATAIIGAWIITMGTLTPDIHDPLQGAAISLVSSFQYFVIALILFSLTSKGRNIFFERQNHLRNQVLLSVLFILVFMVIGGAAMLPGAIIGAALTFVDALFTAYFTILLGWNVADFVHQRVKSRPKVNWTLFVFFVIAGIIIFGGAYMYLGLATLPFEQQIILLIFPLGFVILPIMTVIYRDRTSGPSQTGIMTIVLLGVGIYYTFRLISIGTPHLTLVDIIIQLVIMIYGLSTTVANVDEKIQSSPISAITLILAVILSRVGTNINMLLAASVGLGNIVKIGVTSFTILNIVLLGTIIPVYWLYKRKATGTAE
ncbi:MAG: hypothetical protein ACTSYL_06000 [Candidatus Thorarchaeota archaeon]